MLLPLGQSPIYRFLIFLDIYRDYRNLIFSLGSVTSFLRFREVLFLEVDFCRSLESEATVRKKEISRGKKAQRTRTKKDCLEIQRAIPHNVSFEISMPVSWYLWIYKLFKISRNLYLYETCNARSENVSEFLYFNPFGLFQSLWSLG